MAIEIFMPKMSDHMEMGRIIRWLVKEGDPVSAGQVLLELETDKAVGEIEAPISGILKRVRAVDGDEVPVGETLAFIAGEEENAPHLKPLGMATKEVESHQTVQPPASAQVALSSESGIVPATPIARKVAKELGVDLSKVKGTGPGGRVREEDVRSFAAATSPAEPDQDYNLTTIQRITGQRMLESVTTAPHFFLHVNVDMSQALALLESAGQRSILDGGEKVSITALLVFVTSVALKQVPRVNASFENGVLHGYSRINIGVAVGTAEGLAVPVIRNADRRTLEEINLELREYQSKGKDMRFNPGDLEGGTFTISNLGMYGVDFFSAIINPPQSALLAVGRIVNTPVALEDESVVVRPMMALTLSVDHRALDGIQGAQFLAKVKSLLEDPQLLI